MNNMNNMNDFPFDPEDIPVADGHSREDFGTADEVRGWNMCRDYVIGMLRGDDPRPQMLCEDCERDGEAYCLCPDATARSKVANSRREPTIYLSCSGGCGLIEGPFVAAVSFFCSRCAEGLSAARAGQP